MNSLKTGLYRHIKGNHYYVYGTAKHSETQETMVIYSEANAGGDVWVRPLNMFMENVETEQGMAPRFSYINESVLEN